MGGATQDRSWAVVKPGGVLVSVVGDVSVPARRRDARGVFFVVEPDRAALGDLARRMDAGELRPVVGNVFPLARGGEAFAAKRQSGIPGKVVLQLAA